MRLLIKSNLTSYVYQRGSRDGFSQGCMGADSQVGLSEVSRQEGEGLHINYCPQIHGGLPLWCYRMFTHRLVYDIVRDSTRFVGLLTWLP